MRKMTEDQLRRVALLVDRLTSEEGGTLEVDADDVAALRALRASAEDVGIVGPGPLKRGWGLAEISRARAERGEEELEITFAGASDDIVLISGAPGADEPGFTAARRGEWNVLKLQGNSTDPAHWSGSWRVIREDGSEGLRVHSIYDGCWTFAVGKLDEESGLPEWKWELRPGERGYSLELVIKAPPDALIEPLFKPQPSE